MFNVECRSFKTPPASGVSKLQTVEFLETPASGVLKLQTVTTVECRSGKEMVMGDGVVLDGVQ
jgi:hypothetical protein